VLAKARDERAEPLDQQDDTYGRFAWLMDPLGAKIELWQPPATGPEA
jgi:hypothetical protein